MKNEWAPPALDDRQAHDPAESRVFTAMGVE